MPRIIGSTGRIDLTSPPTNIGTTTPPAITVSTIFQSANSGNVAFVAQPSGTGSFQLQQTDNTATGGNARGANAVDLQTSRTGASQVASGVGAFAAGIGNTASGSQSFALGRGSGSSGSQSFAMGQSCNANGDTSFALGHLAFTKGITSLLALNSNPVGGVGKNQLNILNIGVQTTTVTPARLASTAAGTIATNQLVLQNNSALAFFGLAVAAITGGGDTACWIVQGGIKRGANAASTELVGTPTAVSIGANAGAAAWTLAITADITLGCLAATATNGNDVTVRVNLSLLASEVAF